MNARVDPATVSPQQDDRDLVSVCRAALRTIDQYKVAEAAVVAAFDAYDRVKPPYPELAWHHPGGVIDSVSLRRFLKERGQAETAEWRAAMRAQVAASVEWERACKPLRAGMDRTDRHAGKAHSKVIESLEAICGLAATTPLGAAYKAAVLSSWLPSTLTKPLDIEERLVVSLLDDVRMIGTGGGEIDLASRREAA